MRTLPIALALALAASASGCVHAGSNAYQESFDQTVALAPGSQVSIDNVNGSVRVATWDRDEVKIEAIKKVAAGSQERAKEILARTEIEVQSTANQVSIRTHAQKLGGGFLSWVLGGSSTANVAYTITVPAHVDVVAKTINGPVSVKNLVGRVKAGTVNGGIDIAGIVGGVDAETVNGSIEVAVTALVGSSPMSLSTVNGGITLALPSNASASIDAQTTNGGIDCRLPLSQREKGRRHLRGELGGGGVAIDLETTNGGIDIVES